jgi:hypothetical protein
MARIFFYRRKQWLDQSWIALKNLRELSPCANQKACDATLSIFPQRYVANIFQRCGKSSCICVVHATARVDQSLHAGPLRSTNRLQLETVLESDGHLHAMLRNRDIQTLNRHIN